MREPTAPAYDDRRAPEYGDWYLGRGLFADRERDGFDEELGHGLELPFADDSFERIVSGHFYEHLDAAQRVHFLREASRVAAELVLVLVDASRAHSEVDELWQPRVLEDGSRWEVYKRYFSPDVLLAELGGGEILHVGRWFVVARAHR